MECQQVNITPFEQLFYGNNITYAWGIVSTLRLSKSTSCWDSTLTSGVCESGFSNLSSYPSRRCDATAAHLWTTGKASCTVMQVNSAVPPVRTEAAVWPMRKETGGATAGQTFQGSIVRWTTAQTTAWMEAPVWAHHWVSILKYALWVSDFSIEFPFICSY